MLKTHYTVLGITENAILSEIKSAYRSRAVLCHPDKNNGSAESQAQFIAVNQAYCILSDENKRKDYDRKLAIYRENLKIQEDKAKRAAFESMMRTVRNMPKEEVNGGFKPFPFITSILFGFILLLLSITLIDSCDSQRDTTQKSSYTNSENHRSGDAYRNISLSTGAKPYLDKFGAGEYDEKSLSYIKIENGAMADAIVLLYNVDNGAVYRHAYIKAEQDYTLQEIPNGIYDMKVYHGNGWNNNKDNGVEFPKGGFEYDESFSHSERSDYFDIRFTHALDGISYPSYTVTLYEVKNGNMSTEKISKKNFFN